MTKQELNNLIDQVNNGTASEEELRLYTIYLNQITSGEEAWDIAELGEEEVVKAELLRRIERLKIEGKAKKVVLWPRIAVVAAAVALIVLGVYFFNAPRHADTPRHPELVSGSQDIAPGKNGATITLANGKVINLSDAKSGVVIGDDKLAYNDGSEIDNSSLSRSDILLRRAREGLGSPRRGESSAVAKTAKGQTYEFTLPDGTKVWLNAASTLTIPSDFSGTESRKVALTGEAYFEVFKNKKRPFIVQINEQEVTVLGTHFNVNGYKDEKWTVTTLLEGAVKVGTKLDSKILKPGQQSVGNIRGLMVRDVNSEDAVAWKNGEFVFNDEPLQDIMRRVSRWYDVEVIYQGVDQAKLFNGTISRFEQISKVLDILQATGKVKFKVEGRKVIVTK